MRKRKCAFYFANVDLQRAVGQVGARLAPEISAMCERLLTDCCLMQKKERKKLQRATVVHEEYVAIFCGVVGGGNSLIDSFISTYFDDINKFIDSTERFPILVISSEMLLSADRFYKSFAYHKESMYLSLFPLVNNAKNVKRRAR